MNNDYMAISFAESFGIPTDKFKNKRQKQMKQNLTQSIFAIVAIVLFSNVISAQNITVTVNVNQPTHTVYPTLFGRNNNTSDDSTKPVSAANWKLYREAGVRLFRENGGNNTTKYNWRRKLDSHPDWYNNVFTHDWDYCAKKILDSTFGTQALFGLQLIGYAAKSTAFNFDCWAYDQCKGGSATSNWCANGDTTKYLERWNADSTTGILTHWFKDLKYDSTRFLYWNMDNEPEAWSGTHDDVVGATFSAENYLTKYFAVTEKARKTFPNIKIVGPVSTNEWQWYAWNNAKVTGTDGKDYPWIEYFIKRVAEEETKTGLRLLDVLDFHFYPASSQANTVQLHRIWFDSTFVYSGANGVKLVGPNAWNSGVNSEYIYSRCRTWLTKYMGANHGVHFGLSECGNIYNEPNTDASFYASMLGTFMSEGDVELFSPWDWYTGMWEVMHLFSRYSGTQAFKVSTSDEQNVSVYPTLTANKDTLSLFIVNRNLTNTYTLALALQNITIANQWAKCLQLANLPATETFVSHTSNALKKSMIAIHNDSATISLPKLSVTMIQIPYPKNQTIALQQGWNLISTNVYAYDSTVTALFSGLNVQEVKDMDYFWLKGQNNGLNSLKSIQAGKGYFVKMNTIGTLQITGAPMDSKFNPVLQKGWQLIGCQYQNTKAFSSVYDSTQCQSIKNFDGFWIPNGTANSILNFEPGKGYLLNK